MAKEPVQTHEEAPAEPVAAPVVAPAPQPAPGVPLAPWEAEIEVFWQNVVLNVSPHVETSIHNFLHDELAALKARLKSIL